MKNSTSIAKTVYTHYEPVYTVAVYESTEAEILEAALNASRAATKPVDAETNDLACGMSYGDWREVYGWQNEPGYSERYGFDY